QGYRAHLSLPSFPTRRSSDLGLVSTLEPRIYGSRGPGNQNERSKSRPSVARFSALASSPCRAVSAVVASLLRGSAIFECTHSPRSEEHTSELQSRENLVCRLL